MCFSLLLTARNVSSPTVFDLDGWNRHHFVGNLIAYTAKFSKKNIFHLFPKNSTKQQTIVYENVKWKKTN